MCACVFCLFFNLVLGLQEKRTTQHSKNLSVKKTEDYSVRTHHISVVNVTPLHNCDNIYTN